ncbi:C40 family peptidase [Umezawaea sp. Da 62-37]|uniref:C40 family peptidase n=1 Tax=Umezawaea sp. Da 62-37 TaxID=3075927 RepID=UPI0028F72BCA|nr:C40 family peptidase [Umezawaea sp. Da 62-37]WNV84037.1 C40 family peptidase [Umezawaea sp. Da 62-37]
MTSFPGKRTTRAALAAAVVVAALIVTPTQATADPVLPANASEALKVYTDLTHDAEALNEEHLRAQEDRQRKQGELDRANQDLATAGSALEKASAAEGEFRGKVDLLTEASFEGARFTGLSAMLTASSQQDFLSRMSAMNVMAADQTAALDALSGALADASAAQAGATDAQKRANEASAAATKLVTDIEDRRVALVSQVNTARTQYNSLSSSDRAVLADRGDTTSVDTPAGAAGAALDFALAQRGKPYVFGSNGPNSWDCSSLTQASYRAAGVTIPRTTYTQATTGRSVSRGEVQAGDLIIYYSGQSHVAMAVDNVRAVHAATEGVPVKIANIDDIGSINVIRRIVG